MKRSYISIMRSIYVLIIILTGCEKNDRQNMDPDAFQKETESVKAFSVYKQKTLDELGSFEFERRLDILETIDDLSNQLSKSPRDSIVKSGKTKIPGESYFLVLYDRDLDGKADQFAGPPEKDADTEDFGFIFDLNKVVYNNLCKF